MSDTAGRAKARGEEVPGAEIPCVATCACPVCHRVTPDACKAGCSGAWQPPSNRAICLLTIMSCCPAAAPRAASSSHPFSLLPASPTRPAPHIPGTTTRSASLSTLSMLLLLPMWH